MDRLCSSAGYFGFTIDTDSVLRKLIANQNQLSKDFSYKVRLLLKPTGGVTIENQQLSNAFPAGKIILSPLLTSSRDKFLFHKTTRRQFYDGEFQKGLELGYDDVVFCNENNEVTEGAISNVFIEVEGKLCTPPITCGLLPGVSRRYILENTPGAHERVLIVKDLHEADAVFICNAVRGMRKVKFFDPRNLNSGIDSEKLME